MSRVTCHVSCVTIFLVLVGGGGKEVKLVGGGSVINGATPSSLLLQES